MDSPVSELEILDLVEIKLLTIVDSVESCGVLVVAAGPTFDGVPTVVGGAWVVEVVEETVVEDVLDGVIGGAVVVSPVVGGRLGRVVVDVVDFAGAVVDTVAGAVVDTVVTGGSVVGTVVTHSIRLPSGRKQ